MISLTEELAQSVGSKPACEVLNVPRSSLYRSRAAVSEPRPRPTPARALSAEEKAQVRQVLNSERFCDSSPRQVYATLLDEDETYLCHWRTMYRILDEHAEVRERRQQKRHPQASKPHLVATAPNMVWSWDITKLPGPAKWTYYYLYVIVDIYSRYVVGWLIADKESAPLAEELIAQTCCKQGVASEQLTLHADRGSAMRSKTVALLLADLGVTKSHARPYTPNDNPYSEAQFKTLKYRPDFPDQFGALVDARAWARTFFQWYNHDHRHSALGLMTPATVHFGQAPAVRDKRQQVLQQAYSDHPQRFVRGIPSPPELPAAVWINPPNSDQLAAVEPDYQTTQPTNIDQSSVPTLASNQPGAQAGSRGPEGSAQRALDPDEHQATLDWLLEPNPVDALDRL